MSDKTEENEKNNINTESHKESSSTTEASAGETNNQQELANNIQPTIQQLYEKVLFLTSSVETLNKDNTKIKEENNGLLKKIEILGNSNTKLTERLGVVEKKITALESLIVRNNINVDFLANRDTFKSILLILAMYLDIISREEINYISSKLIYKTKFTALVLKVLKKLDNIINPKKTWRGEIPQKPSKEIEEKNKKLIIFVECTYFIVCCLDNIIHPPEETNEEENANIDIYSKLIGKRNQETLELGLIQFFYNPKTLQDFNEITQNIKKDIIQDKEKTESKEHDNKKQEDENVEARNAKENEIFISFENYDIPKKLSYSKNQKYYNQLNHKNDYNDIFFIQYLFEPNEKVFPGMKINFKEFNQYISEVLQTFKKNNKGIDPMKLMEKLKWQI